MSDIGFFVDPDADTNKKTKSLQIAMTEPNKEKIEKAADELSFNSRSEAYRYFLNLGMHCMIELDPRGSTTNSDGEHSPMTVRDVLPDSEDEAIDVRDEVISRIDDRLLEEVQQDPEINQKGWKVWTKK